MSETIVDILSSPPHAKPQSASTSAQDEQHTPGDDDKQISLIRKYKEELNTFALVCLWIRVEGVFYFDILFLVWFLYYLDVALDINAMRIFISDGDPRYAFLNGAAVACSNAWTAVEIWTRVPITASDWEAGAQIGGSIYLTGYLTPSCLHVFYLVIVSLRIGKKHPLLLCAKLAESCFEASISALVQVYALIFTQWDAIAWIQLSASVCSSFFSIGYAFACFDLRGSGLNGIPGLAKGWSRPLFLVLAFRCAEVASRISSVAIFSVATRGRIFDSDSVSMPEPFDTMVKCFLASAGPLLLALDLLVLFALTSWYQLDNLSNKKFAILSVLCFMNPLLEKGNPFTVPWEVYYSWRWVQFAGMAGAGYYLACKKYLASFDDRDLAICYFCVVCTALWTLLLPFIRWAFAADVITTYTEEMLSDGEFNRSQELLRDRIILRETYNHDAKDIQTPVRTASAASYALLQPAPGPGTRAKFQFMLSTAVERLRGVRINQAAAGNKLIKRAADNKRKKDFKQTGINQDGVKDEKWIYLWADRVLRDNEEKKNQRLKLEDQFKRILHLSANIVPYRPRLNECWRSQPQEDEPWQSSVGNRMLLDVLKELAIVLKSQQFREARRIQEISLDCLNLLTEKLLPPWNSWKREGGALSEKEDDMFSLYREKCSILKLLGTHGWESKSAKFFKDALKLRQCLDPRHFEDLPDTVIDKQAWESLYAPEQMRVIVSLWHSMEGNLDDTHAKAELFRPKVELSLMKQGADYLLKHYEEKVLKEMSDKKAIVHIVKEKYTSDMLRDDVASCCDALSDVILLAGFEPKEDKELKDLINRFFDFVLQMVNRFSTAKEITGLQKRIKDYEVWAPEWKVSELKKGIESKLTSLNASGWMDPAKLLSQKTKTDKALDKPMHAIVSDGPISSHELILESIEDS